MITIIPASERSTQNLGWIQVHSLFSFGEYYDPANVRFGDLLVFNDYSIAPGFGFNMHPHENDEMICFQLTGETLYCDSQGKNITTLPGGVHRITSGTGYAHSTTNTGSVSSRYVNLWMMPKSRNLAPGHEFRQLDPALWSARLAPLVSDEPARIATRGCIPFNGTGTLWRGDLPQGRYPFDHRPWTFGLLYVLAGALSLNGEALQTGDHARILREPELSLTVPYAADVLLVSMPQETPTRG